MLSEKGGNQQLLLLVELEYLRTYTLYDLQNRDSQAAARAQLAVIDCHVCGELERLLYHSIGYYLVHLIAFIRSEKSSADLSSHAWTILQSCKGFKVCPFAINSKNKTAPARFVRQLLSSPKLEPY